jgi:hypothetical protein
MNETMQKILTNILNVLRNTNLSEPFYEAVLNRLISFGYELKEDDCWILCFTMQKVENHILSSCNITSIPDGLFNSAVDMVCGEFLFGKNQTGQLDIATLDLSCVIQQISEGDTTVTFGDGTSDQEKFNYIINHLMTKGEGDFVCFRKLNW